MEYNTIPCIFTYLQYTRVKSTTQRNATINHAEYLHLFVCLFIVNEYVSRGFCFHSTSTRFNVHKNEQMVAVGQKFYELAAFSMCVCICYRQI